MATARTADDVATALLRTPEGQRNPYPLYHQLRALAPVHYSEAVQGWLLTRYDDCKAALRDPRFQKRYDEALDARSRHWRQRPALIWAGRSMLNLDDPAHTRQRRAVFRSFTRGSVEQLRPSVDALTDELLDDLAADRGGDLMDRVAFPLPIAVIGETLGVPKADWPAFRDRTLALTAALEVGVTRDQLDAADVAVTECIAYFDDLIAEKRAAPGDDLISTLLQPESDPEARLTDEEINSLALLLFVGGFETTTGVIGNGVLALLDQPEQLTLLREDPQLCRSLPHELLRHVGTVQLVTRYTTEDVAIRDTVIPAGSAVFPLIGAANRDPARFFEPDRLDVTRRDVHPLAFGGGVHHCLGAALAEMELEIVFRKLVERFDISDLARVRPPHRDRFTLHAPAEVQVGLRTRRRIGRDAAGLAARPAADDHAWRAAYRRSSETTDMLPPEELVQRVALLERVPLFASCRPAELALLAATAYALAFDPGDVLCAQGDTADECYVVVEGEAVVSVAGRGAGVIGADDVVGELGTILDRPRAATVTASSHLLTLALSRERLQQINRANPEAAELMRTLLASRYGD